MGPQEVSFQSPCLQRTVVLSSLVLFVALPSGCTASDDLTLPDAQAFDAYPLYYSGPGAAGLPLEA